MRVLHRIDDRESRLGAEEDRGIPIGHVEVDEQRAVGIELRERRRDVDSQRRRADAALRAEKRVRLSRGRRRGMVCYQTADRVAQLVLGDVADHLRHACTHRLEEQRRLQPRRDDDDAGCRMLPLQDRKRRGQVVLVAHVENQYVRLLCGRLRERRKFNTGQRRRLHSARTQYVFEQPIRRTHEKNVCRHAMSPNEPTG